MTVPSSGSHLGSAGSSRGTAPVPTVPAWRRVVLVLGLLLLAATIWASPRRFPGIAWIGGADVGLASVVASFLVLVGWPRRPAPDRDAGPLLRVLRVVAHPLVAAPLNCLALIAVFATGWYDRAAGSGPGWAVLMVLVMVLGLYADAAVIVPGLLPGVGPGQQVLFATVGGLVDEFPGIAVMVMHRHEAGIAMWIVAQPVIFPVLGVLMYQWVRHDQQLARQADAELDALGLDALEYVSKPGWGISE